MFQWGSKKNLLSVNSGKNVQILSEHQMNSHFNQQVRDMVRLAAVHVAGSTDMARIS